MQVQIELAATAQKAVYGFERPDAISYQARLVSYEGPMPPSFIRLYKTDLGWSSAFEDKELITAIGKKIDESTLSAI